MAAVLVFVVFLVAIALSFPIAESMILGTLAPILTLGKGGSIQQLLNNTFSGANSTPILAVPLFILGGIIMAEGGRLRTGDNGCGWCDVCPLHGRSWI